MRVIGHTSYANLELAPTSRTFLLLVFLCLCAFPLRAERKKYAYYYDSAGNVISRKPISTSQQERQFAAQDADKSPSISVQAKMDDNWTEVAFEIEGKTSESGMLYIFSSNGILIKSIPLDTVAFTLNLSYLHRGLYVFRFCLGGTSKDIKLSKHK